MKKIVYLLVLVPPLLFAQTGTRVTAVLTINAAPVKTGKVNVYRLTAKKPAAIVIRQGQTFVLRRSWHSTGEKVENTGVGTVSGIDGDRITLQAILEAGKTVQKGDIVVFLVPLPAAGKDSLLFKLARYDILLSNVSDSNFWDRNQLLAQPGFYSFGKLQNAMLEDIHYTGQELQVQSDSQDQEIPAGVFKSQKLFATMQKVTRDNLLDFLNYIYARPDTYMAHEWRLSEIFATWLVNGMP